jgi:hypothetical protein
VGNYKLIYFLNSKTTKLFNLKNDLGETSDLAKEMPDLEKHMMGILQGWWNRVNANFPPNYKKVTGYVDQHVIDLTLTSPVNGSTWSANSSQSITWETSGDTEQIQKVDLEYIIGSDTIPLAGAMKASSEMSNELSAKYLNDGDLQTRWEAGDEPSSDQWIEIDFGKEQTFNEVRLTEVAILGKHFSQGEIQYWNGKDWIKAANFTDDKTVKVIKFPPVSGTRARLFIPKSTGNISLWELGFYGYSVKKIANTPNTGTYTWNLPENLPSDIQIQLRANYSYARSGNIQLASGTKGKN